MSPTRILVIDDDFDTLEVLRSAIDKADQNYNVIGVSTAAEALLELKKVNVDFIVADLEPQDMSGVEMAEHVRAIQPHIPIILIQGPAEEPGSGTGQLENIVSILKKPLELNIFSDALLDASYSLIRHDQEKKSKSFFEEQPDQSGEIISLVQKLRIDTGAQDAFVASSKGEVLAFDGHMSMQKVYELVPAIAKLMSDPKDVVRLLGGTPPYRVQYLESDPIDLFCASAHPDYFVALLFSRDQQRTAIGTAWVFAMRAVKELQSMRVTGITPWTPARLARTTRSAPVQEVSSTELPFDPEEPAPPEPEVQREPQSARKPASQEQERQKSKVELDLEAYWQDAVTRELGAPARPEGISFEEAKKLGLINFEDEID